VHTHGPRQSTRQWARQGGSCCRQQQVTARQPACVPIPDPSRLPCAGTTVPTSPAMHCHGLRSAAACWVTKEKGQGLGRGHTWRWERGYKTPARRAAAAIIYTLWPVIFTVYIYGVITVSRLCSATARRFRRGHQLGPSRQPVAPCIAATSLRTAIDGAMGNGGGAASCRWVAKGKGGGMGHGQIRPDPRL